VRAFLNEQAEVFFRADVWQLRRHNLGSTPVGKNLITVMERPTSHEFEDGIIDP
jgi:hypothetical protein